jgi:SAM-dependent methyltransferase
MYSVVPMIGLLGHVEDTRHVLAADGYTRGMEPADPKSIALGRFKAPPPYEESLSVVLEYATDVDIALTTLLDALRAGATRELARVCELGFGPGWLLEEMLRAFPPAQIFGLDMSAAMTRNARERFGTRVALALGDMERLPFAGASFDAIATCWTLYFMDDIDAALDEIRRCLKPGGTLVAATTAADHMEEYYDIAFAATRQALGRDPGGDIAARFDVESGAPIMQRHFPNVELREWRGEMVLPTLRPAMRLFATYGVVGLSDDETAAVTPVFERMVRARLLRDRALRIKRHDGAFVATND